MKKKGISLFELWDKSSMSRKLTSTSTPVTFVEREFYNQVKEEDVINLFQKDDRKVIF